MSNGINRTQFFLPLLLIGLFWMLSACAPLANKKVSQCGGMLNYREMLSQMSVDELEQELILLRSRLNLAGTSCDQLRLAMLLGEPKFRLENDAEVEQLLKNILANEETLAIQDMQVSRLLADEVQWRKKVRNDQQALEIQLQQERAASLKISEQLTDAQLKLKQLKNIDRNIDAREQEISTPSTDKIPHEPK
ncbi:MAG: hypothetical protein RBR06_08910 [Desulfuromonadaceae bacterium]|nr:hypothetical protein [Desulfuromonadaceae bacterium]